MRNIITLTITIILLVCTVFSWYFLLPLYLKSLGASDKAISVLYFLFNLAFYIGQIPGGFLTDRIGRKPIVVGTTLLYALAGYGMAFSSSWIGVSIFYIINALSSSIQMPAILALVFESQEKKGTSFGMTSFSFNLGIAIGPFIGAMLLERIGIKGLLTIYSIAALSMGVARWIFLEETLRATGHEHGSLKDLRMNRTRLLTIIGGTLFFMSLSLTLNGPYISLFQKEGLGLSEPEINIIFSKAGIISAIGVLIFGKIADRIDPAKSWAISSLLHPLLLLGWALLKGCLPLLFISILLAEICYVVYPIFVSTIFSESSRGRGLGIFGFITGSIGSLSPLLVNALSGITEFFTPFLLALGFGAGAFGIIIKVGGERRA
ncbi:MAG: MFS transporter [Synergistetes bacterium]|nr:MFS transporter [Synergistota bacterium]